MCGIAGLVRLDGARASAATAGAMTASLAHRGPDGNGLWVDGPCALGHRRLAVIDLSPAGQQPVVNEDGSVAATFNGEIYNFAELRRDLEKKGHVFKSKSDAEVIVHQYEADGDRCVDKFRGMFSFALWDKKKQRLLAARDRAGKKPFFYSAVEGTFRFASELQAILADPGFPRRLDPNAVDHYFHYQYIPAPLTIWQDVRKLPAGHSLVLEGGEVKTSAYWDLDFRLKDFYVNSEAAEERFRQLFDECVKSRLVSDVPLGAFLSGGIDSSAVVEAMTRLSGSKVKTFSIGFEEAAYSELEAAREFARQLGTEHHDEIVRPNAMEILPALVKHYGEPFADSSAVPTYYLSKMTRQHVTVALSGDGGDESFLGYARVAAIHQAERLTKMPAPARGLLSRLAGMIPGGGGPRSLTRRVKRFATMEGNTAAEHFTELVAYFGRARRKDLYEPSFASQLAGDASEFMHKLFANAPAADITEKALYVEARSYLPEDLQPKVDVASMMSALEVRSPFLDHNLMEFATRLPLRFKQDGLNTKVFLKRALAKRLPTEVLDRPKQGFAVPLENWFRGELREPARELLLSKESRQRGMFRENEVQRYLDEHQAGQDHSSRLWSLMFFEMWAREWLDRDKPAGF
ncbi:MAG: asparagine synthase (glutamine-hydrolyzing) [Planctomycetota bacterium]